MEHDSYKNIVFLACTSELPGVYDKESTVYIPTTLFSISWLKETDIPHVTLEQFLSRQEFKAISDEFKPNLEKTLYSGDEHYKSHFDLPISFTSSGFWLSHRLYDLKYIHSLCSKANSLKATLSIITDVEIPDRNQFLPSDYSLNFSSFGSGISHFLGFLSAGLQNKEIIYVGRPTKNDEKIGVFNTTLFSLLKRLPEIALRKLNEFIIRVKAKVQGLLSEKKTVWKIQEGYDLKVLEERTSDFSFLNPTSDIKFIEPDPSKQELPDFLKEFISRNFPLYESYLFSFFKNHISFLEKNIPLLNDSYRHLSKSKKPAGIFYSIGATTLPESFFAYKAIKENIPVFYFKHGGIENLFLKPSPLDQFFEHTPWIDRHQFIHAPIEEKKFSRFENVKTFVCGPLSTPLPENLKNREKEKNIIFSAGPSAHWTFRDIPKTVLDSEKFSFISELIDSTAELNLAIDLKPHPAEWKTLKPFYEKVITKNPSAQLIIGGSIERILGNYQLVVLDIVSTKVLSALFSTTLEIVLFFPPGLEAEPEMLKELEQRVHIVKNSKELFTILQSFKDNELSKKGTNTSFSANFTHQQGLSQRVESLKQYINQVIE